MSMKIGKAKFGGGFAKRNWWKLKDGESTYRILPPLGNLADDGKWSQFYNVHYGYKNSQGQMRVFQSPLVKNRKTRMVEQPDAALERIETLKAKQKAAKDAGNKEVFEKLSNLLQQYNLDNNHYVNAMDEQGNIGVLKLRHRAKLALDTVIKSLRESGIDPLDADTGRFFTFRRSGNGLDTTFQVGVKKKKLRIDGVGEVEQDIVHTLTPDIIARLSKEAAELDKLYKRLTSEEVARIVATSDLMTGKSPAVDEIFDSRSDASEEEPGEEDSETVATTSADASSALPEAMPYRTDSGDSRATIATAKPLSVASTITVTAKTTPKAAPSTTELSDEDFLKSLGL